MLIILKYQQLTMANDRKGQENIAKANYTMKLDDNT